MNSLRRRIADLWNGHVPMARVFWLYAVAYGTVLNLLTTIAALALFTTDWPAALGFAVFFLPAPYNVLMIISVWKSAARYQGPAIWATLARALIVAWAAAATLI